MVHPKSALYNYRCKLIRVIDGDSILADVDLGFFTWRKIHLRLSDLDAPEIKTKDLQEKKEGLKTAHWLELKIMDENPEGIFYIVSKGVDTFGRSLAEVHLENGEVVNTVMLREQLAKQWEGWKQ
jgi:micrococcal nuclease